MERIVKALKSRTVWTIVAMVIVNGVSSVQGMIPVEFQGELNILLGLLATYFKVAPSQKY